MRVPIIVLALMAVAISIQSVPVSAAPPIFTSADVTFAASFPGCSQTGNPGPISTCQAGGTFQIDPQGDSVIIGGVATATGSYGVLHAYAASKGSCSVVDSSVNCSILGQADAFASATYEDLLTLSNAPPSGTLQVTMQVHGTYSGACVFLPTYTGSTTSCGMVQSEVFDPGATITPPFNNLGYAPTNVDTQVTLLYSFTSTGGVATIGFETSMTIATYCSFGNLFYCAASGDFSNTAIVTGVQVLDSFGNPVSNVGITSASGTDYNKLVPLLIMVPNVVGLTQLAASAAIVGSGLIVGTVSLQSSSTVASGSVIGQSPASGTGVLDGSTVNLTVSSGPPQVAVPNVVGQTQAAAGSAIVGAGLAVGTVTPQSSATVTAGEIISESPAAGTSVAVASDVNLVVSTGPTVVQLLAALLFEVTGVGPGNSLPNKVAQAQAYYAVPDIQTTCGVLTGFVNEVAAQSGKNISPQVDMKLIADAQAIQAAIGCN
jgi:hypothetical protein